LKSKKGAIGWSSAPILIHLNILPNKRLGDSSRGSPCLPNQKTLTGHIDVLQVRNNRIHILDYKPEAQSDKQAVEQLTLYALALGNRTKIPPRNIICGYFDENGYFQFKPSL